MKTIAYNQLRLFKLNLPRRAKIAVVLALLFFAFPSTSWSQNCPSGGVLVDGRAWFGQELAANSCSSAGAQCEIVYFYADKEYATAECDGVKWVNSNNQSTPDPEPVTPTSDACPTGGVLKDGRAWFNQTLAVNTCTTSGAQCDLVYFYTDEEFATAECDGTKWVNSNNQSTPDPEPVTPASDACPNGGVLTDGRAWFNQTLAFNTCTTTGAQCDTVYFYADQEFATAECNGTEWVNSNNDTTPTPPETSPSCPEYVFADNQIYDDGNYLANTCNADSSFRCDNVYYYELPEGGYGYRTSACVAGSWAPESELAKADAYLLRPVVNVEDLNILLQAGLTESYGIGIALPTPGGPVGAVGPTGPTSGPAGPTGPTTGTPTGSPGDSGNSSGGSVEISGTNVQEDGVDEEDRIKSDGDYLYILANNNSLRENPISPTNAIPGPGRAFTSRVRVIDIDPATPSAQAETDIHLDMKSGQRARGLYLANSGDQLVVVGSGGGFSWNWWYNPFAWLDRNATVTSVDVSDPANPIQGKSLEIDGEVISTRRIDNVLYMATRYHHRVPGLQRFDPRGPSAATAVPIIESTTASQLLPSYRTLPGNFSRPLVAPRDCYIPTKQASKKSADVITVTAVNLDTLEVSDSKCFVGATETMYVSLTSMYLATTRYDYDVYTDERGRIRTRYSDPQIETDLHKFDLADGNITYQASGVVDGHLGWNVDRKPFRMSEQGDDLRVVTMTRELTPNKSPVTVSVLRDGGSDRLAKISAIPNADRPQAIGKPGEELYASRFVGDRLYAVTFRVVDPLYVVDLSDPADPYVAGELEIEGYSDYLHPLPNGLMLGLGKDAVPAEPGDDFTGAWYQGVKLSLFDVNDPANPKELNSLSIGKRGTSSDALLNHRAFTYLPQAPGRPARVAIGMKVHDHLYPRDRETNVRTFYDWSKSGLYLFEVDVDASNPVVENTGQMIVETIETDENGLRKNYPIYGADRSLIANDSVFYVHGDDVYAGEWERPEDFVGPH